MVEISRRCRGCGASVRARARFCPQCGRDVIDEQESARAVARAPETQIIEAAAMPVHQESETLRMQPEEVPQKAREGRKPLSIIASDVADERVEEEQIESRVERIRQASNVVLDEAADDPGVRFLLIAAFIFILFIVIFTITTILK